MNRPRLLAMAARQVGLYHAAGLRVIAAKVAETIGREVPLKKVDRYVMLREFIDLIPRSKRVPLKRTATTQPTFRGDVTGQDFLESYEWRKLRMVVLKKRGARCECCGATPADGVRMHVDHVKPRRKYPDLALVESNLQILCEECNHGKGNWDETDWRQDHQPMVVTDEDLRALLH